MCHFEIKYRKSWGQAVPKSVQRNPATHLASLCLGFLQNSNLIILLAEANGLIFLCGWGQRRWGGGRLLDKLKTRLT